MHNSYSLKDKFKSLLPWHPARIETIAMMMVGMIQLKTVNLRVIARSMGSSSLIDSRHKRLKRFFAKFEFSQHEISKLIANWLLPKGKWILCIDRTNWKFGKTHINILMISVAQKSGLSIPLIWKILPKAGNSNTEERIQIMTCFIDIFGSERIEYLAADREFIGQKWFKWLKDKEIPFRIRIKANFLARRPDRVHSLKNYRYFSIREGESMVLNKHRIMWGIPVYLSCYRSGSERVIIASDQYTLSALKDYSFRWKIETLFQAFKGRGFDLESTHITKTERLDRLVSILVLSYCWAYNSGFWRNENKPIKKLKHGRMAQSIFSYGMEWLSDQLFSHQVDTVEFTSLLPNANQMTLNSG